MSEQYIKLSDVVDTIYRDWWCGSNPDARIPSVVEDINNLKTYTIPDEPDFKVGDEVWYIYNEDGVLKRIVHAIIGSITTMRHGSFFNFNTPMSTAYKTKEAAEQALKELRKIEFKEGD